MAIARITFATADSAVYADAVSIIDRLARRETPPISVSGTYGDNSHTGSFDLQATDAEDLTAFTALVRDILAYMVDNVDAAIVPATATAGA